MRSGRSAVWAVLGLGLSGCPGVDPPGGLDDGIAPGSSSSGPGITTFNSTIDPTLPPDGGSMEAESTAEGTTLGVVDGTTTTEPGTTSTSSATGSTSESGSTTTGAPGTTTDETTDPGTTTASGSTTDPTTGGGCNDVPGNYASCLNMAGMIDNTPCMAPGDSTCIYTGMVGAPSGAVCSITECVDACDCPAAPASGSAVVSCGPLTGDPANLFCYLDCGGGETCPTGMTCYGDFCLWPGAAGTPYGDCFNDPGVCGLNLCLNDGAMPTIGVCTQDCMVLGDCPAAPAGGTAPVSCEDVTGDGASECIIDCSGFGATCPPGMTCFGGFLCAWN